MIYIYLVMDYNNKLKWDYGCKKFVKNISTDFKIDKKRTINDKEKREIWDNSVCEDGFNKNIFRRDVIGNVCIKGIRNFNHIKSNVFACEYEHIIPYSKYGPSNVDNMCLLNAKINNKKKNQCLYDMNYYEMKGWCSENAITFECLKKKLNAAVLHETCIEYNLLFVYDNYEKEWTVDINKPYNNKYLFTKTPDDDVTDKVGAEKYVYDLLDSLGIKDKDIINKAVKAALVVSIAWKCIGEENREKTKFYSKKIYEYIITTFEKYYKKALDNISIYVEENGYIDLSILVIAPLMVATGFGPVIGIGHGIVLWSIILYPYKK